jgi:hypothetical protein
MTRRQQVRINGGRVGQNGRKGDEWNEAVASAIAKAVARPRGGTERLE